MRKLFHFGAPLALLVISMGFIWLGWYVYTYRSHLRTTDPTGYHVNDVVSFWILMPGCIALIISGLVITHRIVRIVRAVKPLKTE